MHKDLCSLCYIDAKYLTCSGIRIIMFKVTARSCRELSVSIGFLYQLNRICNVVQLNH